MTLIALQKTLYAFLCYIVAVSAISALIKRGSIDNRRSAGYLWLCVLLAVGCAIAIPLAYRITPDRTFILPWECETVLSLFEARQSNLSTWEFAKSALRMNQGLLSTSAKSALYGVPTYAVFETLGWSTFSLRIVAFLLGLGALWVAFIVIRDLFDTTTASLFVVLFATNPVALNYMGYGVSQSATLLGFLAALCATLKAVRYAKRYQFLWSILAGALLVLATYNYAPGRIFVAITLGFLCMYIVPLWRSPSITTRSRISALAVIAVSAGLYWAQREVNPVSELTAVRGEQVFHMAKHTDQLVLYLGEAVVKERLKSGQLSWWTMVEFSLAVASHRLQEFFVLFSPTRGFPSYWLRGSPHADFFTPYASALIIPILIGFLALLRQLFSVRTLLLLCLFIGGTIPLLFTSRVDNHRSFLLLIPITAWAAHGLALLVKRLRGGWFAETHCAVLLLGFTATLIAYAWIHLGVRGEVNPNLSPLLEELNTHLPAGASIVPVSLNCPTEAAVDLVAARTLSNTKAPPPRLWARSVGELLTDQRFTPNVKELPELIASASSNPVVIISGGPISAFSAWLQTTNLVVNEKEVGGFRLIEIRGPQTVDPTAETDSVDSMPQL